jgi:hypothetical protein
VQIFFLPYLKDNYINFWISLTLAGYPVIRPYRISSYPALPDIRLSGLTGYPAGQSGIRLDIKKGRIIRPAGYPVHP